MGAGIVLLFWLILAGGYAFVLLAFIGLWFLGRKGKIAWLKWFGGLSAGAMLALAIVIAGFFGWGILRSQNPEWVFKETFKVAPSANISKIQSSYYYFADTGSVYLRFQTTEAEFQKLVSARLVKKTPHEMEQDSSGGIGGERPEWWDYQIQSDWIYFLRDSNSNGSATSGFAFENEILAFNPKTQTGYYHFLGID